MKEYRNQKDIQKARKQLKAFLREGGRLTVEDIVSEYFNPKTPYNFLIARAKATQWLCQLSTEFNKMGRMFGRLNPEGKYGFVKNEEEAMYVGTRGYILAKGHIVSSTRKILNGQSQKLLKAKQERVALSQPILIKE